MSTASRSRHLVALLCAVLLFYAGLIGVRAVTLLGDPRWAVKGLGVGVLLLPLVGVLLVAQEIRFGRDSARLGAALGSYEAPDLPRRPSGRIDRTAADAVFADRKADVEAAPGDWRAWYRLGLAYDDAGDRARARSAVRRAIVLERGDAARSD